MKQLKDLMLMVIRRMPFRTARRSKLAQSRVNLPKNLSQNQSLTRVLVLGVFLADRPNTLEHLADRFQSTDRLEVEQRWIEINGAGDEHRTNGNMSVCKVGKPAPKFGLINILYKPDDILKYDYIIVCDDDIYVPHNFLDAFIAYQQLFDLAIAQPARAWQSHFDHPIVLKRPGLLARETRFVECGPLVSLRNDAARLLIPFDNNSPMWGIDLVWPKILERHGLRLGIIDKIAIDHSLRGQGASYKKEVETAAMLKYLAVTPHLPMQDALTVLKKHRREPIGVN